MDFVPVVTRSVERHDAPPSAMNPNPSEWRIGVVTIGDYDRISSAVDEAKDALHDGS